MRGEDTPCALGGVSTYCGLYCVGWIHVWIRKRYSRGQKKLTFRLRATKSFVSVLFYHDAILKSIIFVTIFRFSFSVFPCPTKNVTGERADRWEPRERSIVMATRSPWLRFLVRKAFRVL